MDEDSIKLSTALAFLKSKKKITKLQTDCIGRVEAMYLLVKTPNLYAFIGKDALNMYGINDVGRDFKHNVDFITRLVVDETGSTIDIDNNVSHVNEEDVLKEILTRCAVCNLYVLYGHRTTGRKELLLSKGTTIEQLLVEKELKESLSEHEEKKYEED